MNKKKQHYVPCFYLKNFASSDKIDYFDKVQKKKIPNMHVENVAHQKYYYDFTDEFIDLLNKHDKEIVDKKFLENHFSVLENNIAISFNKVTEKLCDSDDFTHLNEIISEEDKIQFALFIALQSIRTPYYRSVSKNFNSFISKIDPVFSNVNTIHDNELLFLYLSTGALERLNSYFIENFKWSIGVINNPMQAKNHFIREMYVTHEFLISDNPIINLKHDYKGQNFS
ncbi:DUF4238 domain-containing protein [bacterium LRH843]|nr:DUF4238 domain-containing protein [bacterium LRH843]